MLNRPDVVDQFARDFPVLAPDEPKEPLWHYTDAEGFKGIVDANAIHATHFAHLNDPGELLFGQRVTTKALDAAIGECSGFGRAILSRVQKKWEVGGEEVSSATEIFVASFCADNGNRLSQWRGYSKDGAGYSIGFKSLSDADGTLVKVDYRSDTDVRLAEKNRFLAVARQADHFHNLVESAETRAFVAERAEEAAGRIVASIIVRSKHKAFSEEKEWRLVVGASTERRAQFKATRRGLVPYLPIRLAERNKLLNLKGARVGPTHHDAGEAAAVYYLREKGYKNAAKLVSVSGIPFRGG